MADLLISIVGDASKLKGALDNATGQVSSFSNKLGSIGKIAGVAGIAITGAFVLVAKSAIDFNKEVANIATLIPKSTERVNELKSAIRTMAVAVGKDTTDLAKGAYQVISAFGDTADTVKLLNIAAKAATAGVATTTDAIDLLSAVTKGYGDTSLEAVQKVSDLAFQTVTLGQTTFPELAASIGKVTPLAAELGIAQEDLFAVMATGTGVTGKAAEVATQFRGVLQSLMAPTGDMTKLLEEKEYATGEAMIADLGLAGALEAIVKAAEETGVPLQKFIGSIEGQTLALALTGAQADVFKEKQAAMRDSVGLTDIAFKEQTEGVNAAGFALSQAKIQISVLGQEIGDTLLPMITPLIQRVTEMVGQVREWTAANKPLVENIVKWGAGLGVALAVLGPIAVILPSLIAGFGLLAPVMLPLAVGGAIVLGIKKLSEYLKDTVGGMREFRAELGLMKLDAVDAELQSLGESAEQLQKKFYEIPEGFFGRSRRLTEEGQMISTMMDEINERMYLLYQRREELIRIQEEGIDVTKETIDLDKEIAEAEAELAKKIEEGKIAIEDKTKAAELATAQMKIENDIFALTHKAIEVSIRDLDILKQSYLDKGVAQEIVDKWYALEIVRLNELNEKQEEVNKTQEDSVRIMGEVAKVTKMVEDRWFELTRLPYEVKMKDINEKYDDYIEKVKESNLSILAQETAIRNINLARDKELEGIDKVTEAEKEAIKSKELLTNATKAVTDRILELTDPVAFSMQQIDELAGTWRLAGVDAALIAEAVRLLKLELAKPLDKGPWETFFADLKSSFGTLTTNIMNGIKQFVNGVSNAIGNAVRSLLTMKATNQQIKDDMAKAEATYTTEMAKLQAIYNQAKIDGDDIATANALANISDLKKEHETAMQDMSDDMVTKAGIWKTFWSDVKTAAINALIEVIAKQAISALLSMGWVGWLILGIAFIASLAKFSTGGEVKELNMALSGIAKMATGGIARLANGGTGTDTIPAMLTPGEYIISKPMTDFIKSTMAIPANLIAAIASGMPTPAPAFAGGGGVGYGGGAGFGETKIYVDIHDNKISDDIDIKRLAATVSDEILRKINLKRRH